jgi:hypothetical protein
MMGSSFVFGVWGVSVVAMTQKTTKNQKPKKGWRTALLITIPAIAAIVFLLIIFTARQDKAALATCLVEKGFVMGGTSWCPHCASQKALFEGAFEEIILPQGGYKDCDVEREWCLEKGIEGYPSWVTPEGNLLQGVQKLATLERVSGC